MQTLRITYVIDQNHTFGIAVVQTHNASIGFLASRISNINVKLYSIVKLYPFVVVNTHNRPLIAILAELIVYVPLDYACFSNHRLAQ